MLDAQFNLLIGMEMKKTSTENMEDELRIQDLEINTLRDLNRSLITRLEAAEKDAARLVE